MKNIMKYTFTLLLVVALLLPLFIFQLSPAEAGNNGFAGGDGTTGNPYQVATAEQLNNVRNHLDAHFIQTADIDLDVNPYNQGKGWEPIGTESEPFRRNFDGDGYTINNLFIDRLDNHTGLFGYTNSNSKITNVALADVLVLGNDYVGSLVGYNSGDIIDSSAAKGTVNSGDNVGGLVGYNDGDIVSCYTDVKVIGVERVGGLVGHNFSVSPVNPGIILSSFSTGEVSGTKSVGGLVGRNYEWVRIENCYATGAVRGEVHGSDYIGGLVGVNTNGIIRESYAVGLVTIHGDGNAGGLVGYFYDQHNDSYIQNSYYDQETTHQNDDTGKGEPKTTAEMTYPHAEDVYNGWSFGTTWAEDIYDKNNGYPSLQWTGYHYPFDGGDGTQGNPFQVATADQLDKVREYPDAHFIQTANINLGIAPYNEGEGWEPIAPFHGTYDGNNRSISGLFIDTAEEDFLGLFGRVGSSSNPVGLVKNISQINVDITGNARVGGLVGENRGTVKNCKITGNITAGSQDVGGLVGINFGTIENSVASNITLNCEEADIVGGLVGRNFKGIITDSRAHLAVTVIGNHSVGGLVGVNHGGSITGSWAGFDYELIELSVEGNDKVGGLVGVNRNAGDTDTDTGTIHNSYAKGNIAGSGDWIGGLVGHNHAEITGSWSEGSVVGNNMVGGLAGENSDESVIVATIVESYSGSTVLGSDKVGGLVGKNFGLSIENNFSAIIVDSHAYGSATGDNQVGGLVGYNKGRASIVTTYAIGAVSGKSNLGGLVGQNDYDGRGENISSSYYDRNTTGQKDTGKGIPKTTEEMQSGIPSPEIYTGWSTTIWGFTKGEYPQFITSLANADLSALTVAPGDLTPHFHPARVDYTVEVTDDVDSVDITATLSRLNWNASITIDGNLTLSGRSRTIGLGAVGTATEIAIVVTAADGVTQKTYTITVKRAAMPEPPTGEQYTISVSAEPEAGGSVSGGGTFDEGEVITVGAVANPGFVFDNWTENGISVSTANNYTFKIDADRDLVANFVLKPEASDFHTGLYDPSDGVFHLKGVTPYRYGPRNSNWMSLAGDWNSDVAFTAGLYDSSDGVFHLEGMTPYRYGPRNSSWTSLAGDWNGDGVYKVGLHDPSDGVFHLEGNAPYRFGPRNSDWLPIAGDWNGDGVYKVGLYDPADGVFHLEGVAPYRYGPRNSNWLPLAGDWSGHGNYKVGLYDPSDGVFHLEGETPYRYGPRNLNWLPLAGKW